MLFDAAPMVDHDVFFLASLSQSCPMKTVNWVISKLDVSSYVNLIHARDGNPSQNLSSFELGSLDLRVEQREKWGFTGHCLFFSRVNQLAIAMMLAELNLIVDRIKKKALPIHQTWVSARKYHLTQTGIHCFNSNRERLKHRIVPL